MCSQEAPNDLGGNFILYRQVCQLDLNAYPILTVLIIASASSMLAELPGETRSSSARIILVIGLTDEAIEALAERAEDPDAIRHVTC
jgi:hypothetical protein